MKRVFLELKSESTQFEEGYELLIPGNFAHYLTNVVRVDNGEYIELVEKNTKTFIKAQFKKPNKCVIKSYRHAKKSFLEGVNSISVALSKGDTVEAIIKKSTELGCNKINIFKAERSIPLLKKQTDIDKKKARWRSITESAAMQCKREDIPEINFSNSLVDLIEILTGYQQTLNIDTLKIWGSLHEDSQPINKFFPIEKPVDLIIGPEGDFSNDETKILRNCDYPGLSLGQTILRVETAAITAINTISTCWRLSNPNVKE